MIIYLVMGSSGSYSDFSSWIVQAFSQKDDAETFAKYLNDEFIKFKQSVPEMDPCCTDNNDNWGKYNKVLNVDPTAAWDKFCLDINYGSFETELDNEVSAALIRKVNKKVKNGPNKANS